MGRANKWGKIIAEQVVPMLSEPGITRRVIADRLGVQYKILNTNLIRYGVEVPYAHHHPEPAVPMEAALSPEQCPQMRRFLGRLVQLANDNQGRKVDVNRFIKEYRKRVEL